jgi:hypothetical protein
VGHLLMYTRTQIETFIEIHAVEMERWASGQKSWTNTFHPDHACIAIMDAQEVAKHSLAIQGYAAMLSVVDLTTQYEWKDGALVPVPSKPPEREPQPEPLRRT